MRAKRNSICLLDLSCESVASLRCGVLLSEYSCVCFGGLCVHTYDNENDKNCFLEMLTRAFFLK